MLSFTPVRTFSKNNLAGVFFKKNSKMMYTNKKEVIRYNYIMLTLSLGILLIIYLEELLIEIFHIQLTVYSMVIMGALFMYCTKELITKNKIIEYDFSSDVLSIKSFEWYKNHQKSSKPFFEMPTQNLISYEIEQVYLWRYLVFIFINETGKSRKIRFNISCFSRKEMYRIHEELSTLLTHTRNEERLS